jgi:hypothetical protein
VDKLTLFVGGEREEFPLNGENVMKGNPTLFSVHVDRPLGKKREYTREYLEAVLEKIKGELPDWMYPQLVKTCRAMAGGRAKARHRREAMEELGKGFFDWQEPDLVATVDVVSKADDKQQVFGWFSVVEKAGKRVKDRQRDRMTPEEMEAMAYRYVLESREGGEMHKRTGVGKMIESMVFTEEKQKALGIDLGKVGWWGGLQVTDKEVWKRVRDGKYTAFSIHGKGRRIKVEEG